MGNLLAYVLIFDISVCIAIGVGRPIIGGRGSHIHICMFEDRKTINFKKVNNAEHQYMNISSPQIVG
jgi:hypothetical protein